MVFGKKLLLVQEDFWGSRVDNKGINRSYLARVQRDEIVPRNCGTKGLYPF